MSIQDGALTPLSHLVTLIITTSPTPSAPSTDLVASILASFKRHCPALLSCQVIVVFDTYDRIGDVNRLKKGQVTAEGAKAVELYKSNVKDLIVREWYPERDHPSPALCPRQGQAEYGSPHLAHNYVTLSILQTKDKQVTFIEPAGRIGFGLAVRSALREAETPYVWIQQHDWPLARDIPLESLVDVMQASEGDAAAPVKYICLPAVRMLSYATSSHVLPFPALRALTAKFKRDFPTTRNSSHGGGEDGEDSGTVVPLTPLFFWHDKPHIAARDHYRARIFPTRLAIARGDFIEDHVGQRARTQMKEGHWAKWACWLYYPGDGREVCLQHRNGRKWRGVDSDLQTKAMFAEMSSKQRTSTSLHPAS
ncbi:hypothetical protein F4808DRAFT_464005 [Astrocystis sublimbata]|nr:hypothetical protein F4808DRAFT_464005 [Astrocystis sublimbata]